MFTFFSTLCQLCPRRTKEAGFLLQGDRRGDDVSVSANLRPVWGQWTNQRLSLSLAPDKCVEWLMVSLSSPRSEAGSPHSIRHRQVTSYSDIGDKRGIFLPVLSLPCSGDKCIARNIVTNILWELIQKLWIKLIFCQFHTFYGLFIQIICFSLFPPSFYDLDAFYRYVC